MTLKQELLQAKGLLADLDRRAGELETEAKGLVMLIRMALSPYEDDVLALKVDEALAGVSRLKDISEDLSRVRERVNDLKQQIGER